MQNQLLLTPIEYLKGVGPLKGEVKCFPMSIVKKNPIFVQTSEL